MGFLTLPRCVRAEHRCPQIAYGRWHTVACRDCASGYAGMTEMAYRLTEGKPIRTPLSCIGLLGYWQR